MKSGLYKNELQEWVFRWKLDPLQGYLVKALMLLDLQYLDKKVFNLKTKELKTIYKEGYKEEKKRIEGVYWGEVKRKYPQRILDLLGVQIPEQ